ncbi:MAG: aldo/keto reductase, partial [Acidimicrobiales bacterium]|nr:aldo/keto reductase [Acidimicrobiales bacterium]
MQYDTLGQTGLTVSRLALGAMMFGPGGNDDVDDCTRLIHLALDAGVNLIDTADRYGRGVSEEIVGRAIRGRRDDVVVATKCWGRMARDRNAGGASRRWIVRAVEHSLTRLGTDYIDLYQLHRPDLDALPEETHEALSDLVRQGKVRAIGTSNHPAELLVRLHWQARRRHLVPVRSEQAPYSLFRRSVERAVLPTAARHGMGVLVYSPLDYGWLTGKYRADAPWPADSRGAAAFLDADRWDPEVPAVRRKLALVEQLSAVADHEGCTLLELAYGFVLSHPSVSAAIVGPRLEHHLTAALACADRRL